jgi:acetyl-CoA carboxylase biotin carboxylase subunit
VSLSRILIANRGEIARRVIAACRRLGIESVLAVSEADRGSLPARLADRVVCIGPARPTESYLKVEAVVAAALGTACDGIYPGYGFLAEEPGLAEACEERGIAFIGPRADTIRTMGNKIEARKRAAAAGLALLGGSEALRSSDDLVAAAAKIGYPALLKAAAGGGGRGMKVVGSSEEARAAWQTTEAEAKAAFGDGTLYVERYVPRARHIEVQVLGDSRGRLVHLGERDCSLQRRYQKIVEEAPSYSIAPSLREAIRATAVRLAREIGYENAGTIEFILDEEEEKFYFLEMNTRIQVEHPVTEAITGRDLVAAQLRIAAGEPLPFTQEEVTFVGHAIECRVTAESVARNFQPSPGRIVEWLPPLGVRLDTHCFAGYLVPPYYDSLLAKLIVCDKDRPAAIAAAQRALDGFIVTGVETTIGFLRFLLDQADYLTGRVDTRWVERTQAKFVG